MTNNELDAIYQIAFMIHGNEWFGKRENPRDIKEVQEWVAKQLAGSLNVYIVPCGAAFGVLTTKDDFDKYWNENGKLTNK